MNIRNWQSRPNLSNEIRDPVPVKSQFHAAGTQLAAAAPPHLTFPLRPCGAERDRSIRRPAFQTALAFQEARPRVALSPNCHIDGGSPPGPL